MSSVRLDTAALGTLEDDLTFLEAHLLNILLSGVTSRHSTGI